MPEYLFVAHLALLCCIYLFELPILIIGCIQIFKDWNKTYLVKRHRVLIVGAVIFLSIVAFCVNPVASIEYITTGDTVISSGAIRMLGLFPLGYSFVIISNVRIWMLYYDTNYTKFKLQKSWLKAIDPTVSKSYNQLKLKFDDSSTINDDINNKDNKKLSPIDINLNWFDKHEQTYGNDKYLIKRLLFGFFLVYGLTIGTLVITSNSARIFLISLQILVLTSNAPAVIFPCVLYFKLRHFYLDELGIRKEMITIIIIASGYFVVIIFAFIAFLILNWISLKLYEFIFSCSICGLTTCGIYVHTIYHHC